MTTPMIILCLLLLPLSAAWVIGGPGSVRFGGVLGLASAFAFFGIGHFTQTEAMIAMLPEFVPFRRSLVHATGVLEIAIATGFLVPSAHRVAGIAAIGVLIGFFPANIYAAFLHTGMGGHAWGPSILRSGRHCKHFWWRGPGASRCVGAAA